MKSIATSGSSSSRPGSRFSCPPAIPRALPCFQLGRSTPDRNNMSIASSSMPASTISFFNRHAFHFSRRTTFPTNLQLCLSADCAGGQLWPLPTITTGLTPPRVPNALSRLLFCMHRTQLLIASSVNVLLDSCVSDVGTILKIQTYCTRFTDDLMLNELLNLSCKCVAGEDDVASLRIHNCNMALTVNVTCADQSFVDICLPALQSQSIPIFSHSLDTQAAMVGDEFP